MYCTSDEIEKEFRDTDFDASGSVLTSSDVDEIIAQESRYIDGRIGNKYQTPVDPTDSPISFYILKRICIFFVADRVRSVLEVKNVTVALDQDVKVQYVATRKPNKDLDLILEGTLLLQDAEYATPGDGVSFEESESTTQFCRAKEQW